MESKINIINDLRHELNYDKKIDLNQRIISMINIIISDIRVSLDINTARKSFLVLENIQDQLAEFLFREEGVLLPPLEKFVRDFDRVDDDRSISILFKLIKEDNYII